MTRTYTANNNVKYNEITKSKKKKNKNDKTKIEEKYLYVYKINSAKFILIIGHLHGRLKSNYTYLIPT